MGYLIGWLLLHLAIKCEAHNANTRQLNMKMNRLSRITDGLQKDVSDIWTVITTSGLENVEFGNKTRTDTDNFQDKGNGAMDQLVNRTVNDVKELKTELEELILYSRSGFKNEKRFQREAINGLKKTNRDFQTQIKVKNTEINNDVKHLSIQVSALQETSNSNKLQIETLNIDLNENVNETEDHGNLLESMRKMLENLSLKQSNLEMKNQKLEQTISDMQEELTTVQASVSCEKNWTQFNSHCYQYVPQMQSWSRALATCRAKESYLVEITSESELMFVSELAAGGSLGLWIGATDTQPGYEGTFVYQVSKHALPQKFWGDGQPDNDEDEHCVFMAQVDHPLKFFNIPCDDDWFFKTNYVVCEKPGPLVAQCENYLDTLF